MFVSFRHIWLIILTKVENRFTVGDPAFTQNYSKWLPSIGLGLFYNTDNFYIGASVPNLMRTRLSTFDMINSGIQNVNDFHFLELWVMYMRLANK